ncbi:MAG: MASE1 domain-containing protein [Cyclobacteriaceae bacterium]|nr:MASE1 domain-containing protein [Cyclobacteriaceae bacterium]
MKRFMSRQSPDLMILMVALAYYLMAELGYFLSFGDSGVLPLWPPAGIGLALVVLLGRKVWPGIAIGSLIIVVRAFWHQSITSVEMIIAVSAAVTAGRVVEPLAGAYLLKRLVKKINPFSTTLHTFQFVLVVLLVSIISSSITVLILHFASVVPAELVLTRFFECWLSNVTGMVLFAPLLISMAQPLTMKLDLYKAGELALLVLSAVVVFMMLSVEPVKSVAQYTYPFVIIPFLLWLAFRFHPFISTTALVGVALAAFYFTGNAVGPFFMEHSTAHSIFLVQVYVGVISLSALVLSSAVNERQQAQNDLRKFNENLETMVNERTRALQQEINARHEAQLKLQQTNVELTKRNTELDNFVYSVSHDLRAPISSILGLINLAKKDQGANSMMYLEMIEKSAKQQDYFIREILDQSRNARLEVKPESVQLSQLVDETFEQLSHANLKGVQFERIIEINQPTEFYCDKWRLKIILNNLISNAIRYKNGRQPVIRVSGSVQDHTMQLSVADNGRGISKEHLPNLGKMFYRATDEGAGSGLGLYIVKETLAKLNGSMEITSTEGEGTTVTVEIPEATMPAN